jgi:hypothetical protein
VAEKAGERGAEEATKKAFFLIGVDLENHEDVDIFRNNMREMRNAQEDARERKRETYKGLVTIGAAVLISLATSLGSVYVRLGGVLPH